MRNRLWWYNFDPVMRSRLGWCIEWLQANFLVLDDIMDESRTHREKFMTGYQLVFYRENLTLGCSHSRCEYINHFFLQTVNVNCQPSFVIYISFGGYIGLFQNLLLMF
ncbi:putative transferase [Helianthus anomalus]